MKKYIFENNKTILEKLVWWFPNFSSILKEKIGNTYKNFKVVEEGYLWKYERKKSFENWGVRNEKVSK